MLTTIIVGNRFTARKRQFLYTPRGYLGWDKPHAPASHDLPRGAIWVFSGTADGNVLARELIDRHHPVVMSTASAYGREIVKSSIPRASVVSGSMGRESRLRLMRAHDARAIVDATHPFATKISTQLQALALELKIPYLRYERPPIAPSRFAHYFASASLAAAYALTVGKRIFLATGVKDLTSFVHSPGAEQAAWFVRITPDKDSLEQALAAGISRAHICALQGPASQALNTALWKEWNIDCVVTKDSGVAGGFPAKLEAARELGLKLLVIERPSLTYPIRCETFSELIGKLEALLGSRTPSTIST
jgi:precorrin-6x reductase